MLQDVLLELLSTLAFMSPQLSQVSYSLHINVFSLVNMCNVSVGLFKLRDPLIYTLTAESI